MSQRIVICINREYGSGGKTIGEMLSKDLGIHYYDKEILKLAAEESGISEQLFASADANFKKTLFHTAGKVYNGELIPPESSDFTSDQNLFNYQAKVIKELAETESCIIIGRCGGYILRDNPDVVRIFVHAPHYFLMEQAAKKKSLPPRELEKYIEKVNKQRADYNKTYSGWEWDDAHNYDLCVDASKLGFEKCVEIIKGYIKVRFGEN
ncbi:MAG: cytidylate kinase-like family protein [Lachnospiraceae bacterium]|nr:cytidylate kinase-like family protein [Lachnospiraceae bacterium]